MKLGQLIKLEKRKTKTSKKKKRKKKKKENDFMSRNYDANAFYPIYGKFSVIQKKVPDVCSIKLTFSFEMTFYLTKNEKNLKILLLKVLITVKY